MRIKVGSSINSSIFYRNLPDDTLRLTTQNAGVVLGGETLVFADLMALQRQQPIHYQKPRNNIHIAGDDFLDPAVGIQEQDGSPVLEQPHFQKNNRGEVEKNKLLAEKQPVLAVKNYGQGIVAVLACFDVFTDGQMGYSGSIPGANMRNIYELEYWLFQDVLDIKN